MPLRAWGFRVNEVHALHLFRVPFSHGQAHGGFTPGLYLDYQVVDWFERHGYKLGVVDRRPAWFNETVI